MPTDSASISCYEILLQSCRICCQTYSNVILTNCKHLVLVSMSIHVHTLPEFQSLASKQSVLNAFLSVYRLVFE